MRRVRLALPLISVVVASALAAPAGQAAIRNNEVVMTGKVLYAMCAAGV